MNEAGDISALHQQYRDFFEHEAFEGRYLERLRNAIEDGKFRVKINMNDLRAHGYADRLMSNPRVHMVAMQLAAKDAIETLQEQSPELKKLMKGQEMQIGFEGAFGSNSVSPRGLTSRFLNNLVQVEGIVTKVSSVKPKMIKSVSLTTTEGEDGGFKYVGRNHYDHSSMDIGLKVGPQGSMIMPISALPSKDDSGREFELEHGLCVYKDYQRITLQEMPERARVGQLPRSVEILVEFDLVDHVKPGDRVQVVGIYRPLPNESMGAVSTVFRAQLMCNNISILGKEVGAVKLSGNDVQNIRNLGERNNVLQILADSLCPSIFGHEFVKCALILQLLGGCERNLENGTHLRGDINVMFVGDPSTAKSQLLRAVMDIAPLAISTTGKGSSGVGLTAAVSMDPESGEKRLEAGAMVLADRGIVCIDEFDKMGENDRVAIHEVMEQQTVTIAKAGIHASLNARCSVVAAANPIYGQYDKSRRPQENIGLPDSLLSRFDLLFIVLDQLDPIIDRRLSEHVVRSHQYRRPGTIMEPESLNPGSTLALDDPLEQLQDTPVWQRGGSSTSSAGGNTAADGRSGDVLTKEFLRKYIYFAKMKQAPTLSDEAMENISAAYANMRSKSGMKNLPVTARTLETIIRLSSASAKTRLSRVVEIQDVDCAVELINFVLFHEIGEQLQAIENTGLKRQAQQVGEQMDSDLHLLSPGSSDRNVKKKTSEPSPDENNPNQSSQGEDSQDLNDVFASQSQTVSQSTNNGPDGNSYKLLMRVLVSLNESEFGGNSIPLDRLLEEAQSVEGGGDIDESDIQKLLQHMEAENKVMVDAEDRSVVLI